MTQETKEAISDLFFEAAISKAFENRDILKPSIQHFIDGGNVNGQFDLAIKRLMRWVEKKVIESATTAYGQK